MAEEETPNQHRVEHIMSKDGLSFQPDTPLPDVITASSNGDPPSGHVVADVMTSPAFSLHTSEDWELVIDMLRDRGFRRVPVVDDHEMLLGIENRRAMNLFLDEMHAIALRYGAPYSVVLADIDHF